MGKKGEGNRQRIIEAADRLFFQKGYNQTSFQDISDATGIPRGNFYYYFKTKEDILEAVVEARSQAFLQQLREFEAQSASPVERLLRMIDMLQANRDSILATGCPVGSLSTELSREGETLQKKARRVFEVVREWVEQQFTLAGVADAGALAMDLLARIQGIILLACAFKDDGFLNRSHDELRGWLQARLKENTRESDDA